MKAGLEARKVAVYAMNAVTSEGRLLSEALPRMTEGMTPAERARVGRLATGALRWAGRSDRLLGPHLRMKPEDAVLNAMRLAIYEIYVDGAPDHAAVDAAVSMSERSKAGLVNGVLRSLRRREPVWDDTPLPGLPKWLRKRLVSAWGKENVAAMEVVFAADPPLDISLKPAEDVAKWAETLNADIRPDGGLRLKSMGQVSALPGFDDGIWWVQDAGASVGARLLEVKAGESVLDLCAAPGGKTMQLAATGAKVTALDVSKDRMVRVTENLKRTGLSAEHVIADALKWQPDQTFDAILLDAPCSASGTLRRHPDLAHARDGDGIEKLMALQEQLIGRAVSWLKPGGRIVYCTCSLFPEEGEAQIEAALIRHKGMSVVPVKGDWIDPKWQTEARTLRIRPDHWAENGGIDGFFVALLEKRQ
ncbi:methyltransferase domain-containing protein [Rhodobacteraceae bacterium]|nr:methyltransferase domain-containing protein [Paracoccaceae bacterium]